MAKPQVCRSFSPLPRDHTSGLKQGDPVKSPVKPDNGRLPGKEVSGTDQRGSLSYEI